jgi:hypothetical protein
MLALDAIGTIRSRSAKKNFGPTVMPRFQTARKASSTAARLCAPRVPRRSARDYYESWNNATRDRHPTLLAGDCLFSRKEDGMHWTAGAGERQPQQ